MWFVPGNSCRDRATPRAGGRWHGACAQRGMEELRSAIRRLRSGVQTPQRRSVVYARRALAAWLVLTLLRAGRRRDASGASARRPQPHPAAAGSAGRRTRSANDIRNVRSAPGVYPSPIHAEATLFGTGRGVLDGHADFLVDPYPGFHATFRLEKVPLDALSLPVLAHTNFVLQAGPRQGGVQAALRDARRRSRGLLKNHERQEVATVANVSGRIDGPRTSGWQIALRLVENAFFRSILPGFDRELTTAHKPKP